MNLEEYHKRFKEDTDETCYANLEKASIEADSLFCKWSTWLSYEQFILNGLEHDYDILYLQKREFYVDGHTLETKEKGWELPARGQVLKSEVQIYINADQDIIKLSNKLTIAKEKIRIIKDAMDTLRFRKNNCKTILDIRKYNSGSY